MNKYEPPPSALGQRIFGYRLENKLTQADLASRYKVSGPAIFKFEKGYVTPSLELWRKMADDFGISEREAVTLWAREKLPPRFIHLISEDSATDPERIAAELQALGDIPPGDAAFRKTLIGNSEVSPALKKFVAQDDIWDILKPSVREVVFLVRLDHQLPRLAPEKFRDAILISRDIQASSADE